jgi:hypothetical protein
MPTVSSVNFGDQDLLRAYLSGANKGLLSQTYSNLLLIQQQLSVLNIDTEISVKIQAYQQRMFNQARFFTDASLPGFISLLSFGSNFSALVSALNKDFTRDDQTILDGIKNIVLSVTAIADLAKSYEVSSKALDTKFTVALDSLLSLISSYQDALTQLEDLVAVNVTGIIQEIDALNLKTATNIQDIVAGGDKASAGVAEIGKSIIATIGISEDDSKKTAADSKAGTNVLTAGEGGDDKIDYMISGLQSIAGGVTDSSQAARDLKTNNRLLAAAYQQLASANAVLAVAKSIQAQNQLYTDAYQGTTTAVHALYSGWQSIQASYYRNADIITAITTTDDIQILRSKMTLATQEWQILSQEIGTIKASYAGNGSLPDAN